MDTSEFFSKHEPVHLCANYYLRNDKYTWELIEVRWYKKDKGTGKRVKVDLDEAIRLGKKTYPVNLAAVMRHILEKHEDGEFKTIEDVLAKQEALVGELANTTARLEKMLLAGGSGAKFDSTGRIKEKIA